MATEAIPDLPGVPSGKAVMIETASELEGVVKAIRASGSFAYDTEFIGEETYFPHLCLVQLATTEDLWLVDPFSVGSLDSIWRLIADPDIETIVHAGAQDLEPVERYLDVPPSNVVDTQLAAGFTGQPYPVSLARLIMDLVGWEMPKGMTFTDWSARPLSAKQLRYAAGDVRFLPLIWSRMKEHLEAKSHLDAARDEFASICRPGAYRPNIEKQCRKMHRRSPLRKLQWKRLHLMMALRNNTARERNVPPRTLMPDNCVSYLVRHTPGSLEDLSRIKGMPRPTVECCGEEILDIIARKDGFEDFPDIPRKLPEETAASRIQIDSICSALACWCMANEIAPPLVNTRNDIADWVQGGGLEHPEDGPWPDGWRRRLAGDFLHRFLTGACTLPMQWKDDRLRLGDDCG